MQAVNEGNVDAEQKMVDDAAKEVSMATDDNGELIDLYHGTPLFGFTTFDTRGGTRPIFTTTRRNVSANYAGDNNYAGVRRINQGYKGATTTEGIIQNAKSVLGQEWRLVTDEERQRVIDKTEEEAKRIAAEIERRRVDVAEFPKDDELDIANAIGWVEDLFYTVADGRVNGNEGEDLYRLVNNGVERYQENKQVMMVLIKALANRISKSHFLQALQTK